jgi:hypothetical protein
MQTGDLILLLRENLSPENIPVKEYNINVNLVLNNIVEENGLSRSIKNSLGHYIEGKFCYYFWCENMNKKITKIDEQETTQQDETQEKSTPTIKGEVKDSCDILFNN